MNKPIEEMTQEEIENMVAKATFIQRWKYAPVVIEDNITSAELNAWGREGWELVTINHIPTHMPTRTFIATFKRKNGHNIIRDPNE